MGKENIFYQKSKIVYLIAVLLTVLIGYFFISNIFHHNIQSNQPETDLRYFKLILVCTLISLVLLFILFQYILINRYSRRRKINDEKLQAENIKLEKVSNDLKKSNEKLRNSDKEFRSFFDSSYDLIQTVDLAGNFLYANPSWLQSLGYHDSDIDSLNALDVIHPDYQDQYLRYIKKTEKNERVLGADMVFLTKERDAILLNGNLHLVHKDGQPHSIRGVFRDDTKRKLALKKLEESEKQYRFLVESANDIIFRTDVAGRFVYVNEVIEKVTGYAQEEFVAKSYLDMVKKEYHKDVIAFYQNQFDERKVNSYLELEIQKKDGSYIWIGQNVKTIFRSGDKNWVDGYLVVSREITDRKKKEQQIEEQNKILEEQHRAIKQSIRYAKRIQDSIIPNENEFRQLIPESFVYYKPKDIVSGDFYWLSQRDDCLFVAVADCTGHGVPGAFMSIIGHNQLENAINKKRLTDTTEILKQVSSGLKTAIKRPMDEFDLQDGMDIALCIVDMKKRELQFSGAFNDLYLIRNKKLQKYRGTRVSVGVDDLVVDYEKHMVSLEKGDVIYMFSDGYVDQFGGNEGRKFGYDKFRKMLLDIHEKEMAEQRLTLEDTMNKWVGKEHQIDDICVMGVRF